MPPRLWKIGHTLLITGVCSIIGIVIFGNILYHQGQNPDTIESMIQIPSFIAMGIFGGGAIIVWLFALKFYRRRHFYFPPVQSGMYLLVLICTPYLAPYIFIHLEGRERFFDFEN